MPGLANAARPAFQVNDTNDRVDSNLGDGLCRRSQNTCTLRAGIQQANILNGADTNQNYGTDSGLKVDSKSGANARALFRFNLPGVPSGCQVTSAKLRLYATLYKTGRTLQALMVAAPWTEEGLTWNNQPATTGAPATVASGSGYREWTVTQQVLNMYAPANNGFLVRDATENGGGIDQVLPQPRKGQRQPAQARDHLRVRRFSGSVHGSLIPG